ncbi:hypothetical protein VPH35_131386 [Triticum aestivum]
MRGVLRRGRLQGPPLQGNQGHVEERGVPWRRCSAPPPTHPAYYYRNRMPWKVWQHRRVDGEGGDCGGASWWLRDSTTRLIYVLPTNPASFGLAGHYFEFIYVLVTP